MTLGDKKNFIRIIIITMNTYQICLKYPHPLKRFEKEINNLAYLCRKVLSHLQFEQKVSKDLAYNECLTCKSYLENILYVTLTDIHLICVLNFLSSVITDEGVVWNAANQLDATLNIKNHNIFQNNW